MPSKLLPDETEFICCSIGIGKLFSHGVPLAAVPSAPACALQTANAPGTEPCQPKGRSCRFYQKGTLRTCIVSSKPYVHEHDSS